jgi:hypothetical protein
LVDAAAAADIFVTPPPPKKSRIGAPPPPLGRYGYMRPYTMSFNLPNAHVTV